MWTDTVDTPLGKILLAAENDRLFGLWFEGQQYEALGLVSPSPAPERPVFAETRRWLACYFSGRDPGFTPPLAPAGTPFRQLIRELMLAIPYGQTTTYATLARQAAERLGRTRMSAQAVGGAVGHNAVSLIVPCHRVIGTDGSLTGYAGGLWRKQKLLELEGTSIIKEQIFTEKHPFSV